MPSRKENPQAANLNALLKGLSEAGIEFIIVGGMAAVAQGAPVTTFDLDIVHHQTDDNIKKLSVFLKSINAFQRRPDDKIIEPTEKDLKAKGHILLNTRYGPMDILAYIEKDRGFKDLLTDAVEIELHRYKVYVLSLHTLIELKRDSKDPMDQYRLPIFEETLRQSRGNHKK
jgi:predicted nucleotidyltransferase